jgi:hypothetical protein
MNTWGNEFSGRLVYQAKRCLRVVSSFDKMSVDVSVLVVGGELQAGEPRTGFYTGLCAKHSGEHFQR